jgi:hypothetical protein
LIGAEKSGFHVPSVKKQADDAKRLAKLLARVENNLKARDAKSKISTAAF